LIFLSGALANWESDQKVVSLARLGLSVINTNLYPENGGDHLRDLCFLAQSNDETDVSTQTAELQSKLGQTKDQNLVASETGGIPVLILLRDQARLDHKTDKDHLQLPAGIETMSSEFLVLRYRKKRHPDETIVRNVIRGTVTDSSEGRNLFRTYFSAKNGELLFMAIFQI